MSSLAGIRAAVLHGCAIPNCIAQARGAEQTGSRAIPAYGGLSDRHAETPSTGRTLRRSFWLSTKPGVLRPVVIPRYASIPVFIIKNNLRTAGMTRERYFELLGQS